MLFVVFGVLPVLSFFNGPEVRNWTLLTLAVPIVMYPVFLYGRHLYRNSAPALKRKAEEEEREERAPRGHGADGQSDQSTSFSDGLAHHIDHRQLHPPAVVDVRVSDTMTPS